MPELKRLDGSHPYQDYWYYKYFGKKGKRFYVTLVHKVTRQQKLMSWARYQMSVHFGRILNDSEIVDHIDEDKTNDNIDNYQIITMAENTRKPERNVIEE